MERSASEPATCAEKEKVYNLLPIVAPPAPHAFPSLDSNIDRAEYLRCCREIKEASFSSERKPERRFMKRQRSIQISDDGPAPDAASTFGVLGSPRIQLKGASRCDMFKMRRSASEDAYTKACEVVSRERPRSAGRTKDRIHVLVKDYQRKSEEMAAALAERQSKPLQVTVPDDNLPRVAYLRSPIQKRKQRLATLQEDPPQYNAKHTPNRQRKKKQTKSRRNMYAEAILREHRPREFMVRNLVQEHDRREARRRKLGIILSPVHTKKRASPQKIEIKRVRSTMSMEPEVREGPALEKETEADVLEEDDGAYAYFEDSVESAVEETARSYEATYSIAERVQTEINYLRRMREAETDAAENMKAWRACAAFLKPIQSAYSLISNEDGEYAFGRELLDAARSISKKYSSRTSEREQRDENKEKMEQQEKKGEEDEEEDADLVCSDGEGTAERGDNEPPLASNAISGVEMIGGETQDEMEDDERSSDSSSIDSSSIESSSVELPRDPPPEHDDNERAASDTSSIPSTPENISSPAAGDKPAKTPDSAVEANDSDEDGASDKPFRLNSSKGLHVAVMLSPKGVVQNEIKVYEADKVPLMARFRRQVRRMSASLRVRRFIKRTSEASKSRPPEVIISSWWRVVVAKRALRNMRRKRKILALRVFNAGCEDANGVYETTAVRTPTMVLKRLSAQGVPEEEVGPKEVLYVKHEDSGDEEPTHIHCIQHILAGGEYDWYMFRQNVKTNVTDALYVAKGLDAGAGPTAPPIRNWRLGTVGKQPLPLVTVLQDRKEFFYYTISNAGVDAVNTVFVHADDDGEPSYQSKGIVSDPLNAEQQLIVPLVMRRISYDEVYIWIIAAVMPSGATQVFYVNQELGALKKPPPVGWVLGQNGSMPLPTIKMHKE